MDAPRNVSGQHAAGDHRHRADNLTICLGPAVEPGGDILHRLEGRQEHRGQRGAHFEHGRGQHALDLVHGVADLVGHRDGLVGRHQAQVAGLLPQRRQVLDHRDQLDAAFAPGFERGLGPLGRVFDRGDRAGHRGEVAPQPFPLLLNDSLLHVRQAGPGLLRRKLQLGQRADRNARAG
jgi:hypothetical protein